MVKLTIFQRLALGFFIFLLALSAIGIYATVKFDQFNKIIHSINAKDNKIINLSAKLRDIVLTQRKFGKMYAISQDPDFQHQFVETKKYIQENFMQLGLLIESQEYKSLLLEAEKFYDEYLSLEEKEADLIQSGKEYSLKGYEEKKEAVVEEILHALNTLWTATKRSIDEKIDVSERIASQASSVVPVITLASVFMGLLIAFLTSRAITRPLLLLADIPHIFSTNAHNFFKP